MQALFEASMYTFVFLWTPALNPHAYVPSSSPSSSSSLSSSPSLGAPLKFGGGIGGIGGAPSALLPGPPAAAGSSHGATAGRALLSAGTGGGGGGGASEALLPHGFVFAIFMTASMVGTALAGRLMASTRLEAVLRGVFWAGAALLAVPAAYHTRMHDRAAAADVFLEGAEGGAAALIGGGGAGGGGHTVAKAAAAAAAAGAAAAARNASVLAGAAAAALLSPSPTPTPLPSTAAASTAAQLDAGGKVQLLAFCGFEVLIGLFWPSMMALRARYVPEAQRATVINAFRVPLNVFVCAILWKVSDFPLGAVFGLCSGFLLLAALAQSRLAAITRPAAAGAAGGAGGGGSGSGGHLGGGNGSGSGSSNKLLSSVAGGGSAAGSGGSPRRIVVSGGG